MKSYTSGFLLTLSCLAFLWSTAPSYAEEWPKGYMVAEDSESPNHQYGILIHQREEENGDINQLVDLKDHRLLGKIKGADYYEGQRNHSLNVTWAEDSKACVVEYGERWGFSALSLLEPTGARFAQTDLGERIKKAVSTTLSKQSSGEHKSADTSVFCEFTTNQKVHVRALATTDPKGMSEGTVFYTFFDGRFDVKSKKWSAANAVPLTGTEYGGLETAFRYSEGEAARRLETILRDEDKATQLDRLLNEMYEALRYMLPAKRFTKLKQEQLDWLKKRDATAAGEAKLKVVEERIEALYKLVPP